MNIGGENVLYTLITKRYTDIRKVNTTTECLCTYDIKKVIQTLYDWFNDRYEFIVDWSSWKNEVTLLVNGFPVTKINEGSTFDKIQTDDRVDDELWDIDNIILRDVFCQSITNDLLQKVEDEK